MKKTIILFWIFLPYFAFSQGENNNWYFGNGQGGVNFNTTPPSILTDNAMYTHGGVATISDALGNLLFYTNGKDVWNRQHEIMLNGTDLTAGMNTQQVIILPHPGNPNQYYIFTMANNDITTNFNRPSYSVVDMSLGQLGTNLEPLGIVIPNSKNIQILNGEGQPLARTEAVTSVLHSDNQSYWVLFPNNNNLYSYRLDSGGFDNNNPITSNLGFDESYPFISYGSIKASPNLSYDLEVSYSNLISITKRNQTSNEWKVYSFNNNTGLLTSDYEMELTSIFPYSSEFNSDGTLLYGANQYNGDVEVIDVFSGNIRNVYLGWGPTGDLQRAVTNDIYYSRFSANRLYIISDSDSFLNSNIEFNHPDNIYFGIEATRYGLPQLIPKLIFTCYENLTLDSPELNPNMVYKALNKITALQNYKVELNAEITLSAGSMVEILPDSHIENGSVFRAMIEGCDIVNVSNAKNRVKNSKPIKHIINLDKIKNEFDIKIHPNPLSGNMLYVTSYNNVDKTVAIFDVLGKQVINTTTVNGAVNVANLNAGVYIVKVTEEGKTTTRKLVVK